MGTPRRRICFSQSRSSSAGWESRPRNGEHITAVANCKANCPTAIPHEPCRATYVILDRVLTDPQHLVPDRLRATARPVKFPHGHRHSAYFPGEFLHGKSLFPPVLWLEIAVARAGHPDGCT